MRKADPAPLGKQPAWREPWFWFVMTPLIFVVILGAVLLSAAFIGADNRVYDDYYQQGRMINNRFAAKEVAKRLAIRGGVAFDLEVGEVWLHLDGETEPKQVLLSLSHPSDAELDHQLVLQWVSHGRYRGELERAYGGRWYVLLSPGQQGAEPPWRVASEVDFSQSRSISFDATDP